LYESFAPKAAKTLMPDGSVTADGNQILPPDPDRAALYESYAPSAAKYLHSDGSVTDSVGGGGGAGGTVRWFSTTAERDAYYAANPGQLKEGVSVGVGNPVSAYTYDGTAWLTGALAFRGVPGETPQFRMDGAMLQYRFATQTPTVWTDLYELQSEGTYVHSQTAASDVWYCQHNHGKTAVSIFAVNSAGEQIVGQLDAQASTVNLAVIRFSEALAGTAYIKS
jgi:hypothetical protein